MIRLRPVVRLVSVLWLLALALVGLAVALYCFDSLISLGAARPDRLLHLVRVEHRVGDFLRQLGVSGPAAGLSLLCGIGAVAFGILLLLGSLVPARERTALMEPGGHGTLAVRRSVLRRMVRALAEPVRGVASVGRPRLRLRRRGRGGTLLLPVTRTRSADSAELARVVGEAIEPVTAPFELRGRIRVTLGERGRRVQ